MKMFGWRRGRNISGAVFFFWFLMQNSTAWADTPAGLSIHGEYETGGAIHWTGGAGDKTLLRRGAFFTDELKLRIDQPLEDGWDFLTSLHLRQTFDPQIDKRKDVHILGYTSEIYNRFLRFTFGDFFADFSQYVLGTALDGVQMVAKTDRAEIKAVAGFSQRADEGKQFMRYVFAGRAETVLVEAYGFAKDLRMGFNFSDAEDAHNTIDNTTGVADASNRVGSVNGRAVFWGHTQADWEAAKSWIDEDTSPGTNVDRKTGSAIRWNSTTQFDKKNKLRMGYEWVSADFRTLGGSAVPDRVNVTSRLDSQWNKEWKSELGYRLSFDKLDKSDLNKRTVTQAPRAALNWEPLSDDWWLKDFFSRLYWELRSRLSDDDPSGQTDFLSNDAGFEDEFRIEKVHFNSGWTVRTETDDLQKQNDRLINTGYIGMNTHEQFLGMGATPSLRYQFDYEDRPKEGGRDLTQSVSAGLNMDISDNIHFEQRYGIETASRLAPNADTVKLNAYLGLDYKIPSQRDLTLKITYEHGNFFHPLATERFSEDNLQVCLFWKF